MLDVIYSIQVGDGAGNFQDALERPSVCAEPLISRLEQPPGAVIQGQDFQTSACLSLICEEVLIVEPRDLALTLILSQTGKKGIPFQDCTSSRGS